MLTQYEHAVMLYPNRARKNVTPVLIEEAFFYDPQTGKLTWKERPANHFASNLAARIWNTKYAGTVAGRKSSEGYLAVALWGFEFYVHRIAIVLLTGEWPKLQVDHVNGDRTDNRSCNLRVATHKQNAHNSKKYKSNTVGLKGVSKCPGCKTFRAQIYHDKKAHHLGTFKTEKEAHDAYARAARSLRGEFARVS